MKKMITSLVIGLFITITSVHAEDPVITESTYFHVEQAPYIFLEADALAVMDQKIEDFLTNFNLVLNEKIKLNISSDNGAISMTVDAPDELLESVFIPHNEMMITYDGPLLKFGIDDDSIEAAKWIGVKFALDYLLEAKITAELNIKRETAEEGQFFAKGYYGSMLTHAYPRFAIRSFSKEQQYRAGMQDQIEYLAQERGNFILAAFFHVFDAGDPPVQEEVENELEFYNEVMYPLTNSLLDFVIDNYGYGKLLEFMINDNIEQVFGITDSEFEDLWYDYNLPADPTP